MADFTLTYLFLGIWDGRFHIRCTMHHKLTADSTYGALCITNYLQKPEVSIRNDKLMAAEEIS